jgi:hypothetical protein
MKTTSKQPKENSQNDGGKPLKNWPKNPFEVENYPIDIHKF